MEGGNLKKQNTLAERGTRPVVWTDCGAGSGKQTLMSLCESTGWNDKPEGHEGQDGCCTNFERKQHPTFRFEHTTVWRAMCESLLQMPKGRVPLRHVPPDLHLILEVNFLGGQHGS